MFHKLGYPDRPEIINPRNHSGAITNFLTAITPVASMTFR